MYRHATYINCSGCGRKLSFTDAELDEEARYICARCNALKRVDFALARWKTDARRKQQLKWGAAVMALAFVVAVPAFLVLVGFVVWIAQKD